MLNDYASVQEALGFVPCHERDVWVQMGMAVKSALGESGREIWTAWGANDDSYREKDAAAVWRSIKASGGIGPGSLYAAAKANGWRGVEPVRDPAAEARHKAQAAEAARKDAEATKVARIAAQKLAVRIVNESRRDNHPYLAAKGFPGEVMFVREDQLIVPMWAADAYGKTINSLQRISPDGEKKFLKGGRAKGSIYRIGSGAELWLCEGLATGLSIRDALKLIYRRATVVVCFSAGNLGHVAKTLRGVVVADHDASGTGERVARETGMPWWMPPDINTDANDFHGRYGLRNLSNALNRARQSG